MKKAIGLFLIVAVMTLVFVGGVFAAPQVACDNSQAHGATGHASVTGQESANQVNSVFACSEVLPG